MTQNVKKRPGLSKRARTWLALCALGLGGSLAAAGCSSDCSGDECAATCSEGDCAGGGGGGGGTDQPGAGRFSPCETSDDCDREHGFSCVEGECNFACRSHADCVEVGHCDSRVVDGERRNLCVRDAEPPQPGGLHTACPNGDECDDARLCLGAGAGDLDAYCSVDCADDADCAAGYYCGAITRQPCADACDLNGRPEDPRCIPPELIGDDQPYRCSRLGVVRSVCRQREFCSSCESDADCLAKPNQVCARDESGQKICTRLCDTGTGSCPWGNAARCAVFDEELGRPTCSHRFGSCQGTGKPCEPCTQDADCPNGVCAASQFTGERWCIDLSVTCECPSGGGRTGTCTNGGCPESPSGLPLMCVAAENFCYAANSGSGSLVASSPQTGCWGAR